MAKSTGESIIHAVGVRMRVVGDGSLITTLLGYDAINQSELFPLTLAEFNNQQPVVLANFRNQRIQIELKVEDIDEWFLCTRLVLFVKESATGYPQS